MTNDAIHSTDYIQILGVSSTLHEEALQYLSHHDY